MARRAKSPFSDTEPQAIQATDVNSGNSVRTLELRCNVDVRPDLGKEHAERFTATYGSPPSAWDPEGATRAILGLSPTRVVTLG